MSKGVAIRAYIPWYIFPRSSKHVKAGQFANTLSNACVQVIGSSRERQGSATSVMMRGGKWHSYFFRKLCPAETEQKLGAS